MFYNGGQNMQSSNKQTQLHIHIYVDQEIAEETVKLKNKRKLNKLIQELLKKHFQSCEKQGELFND